MFCQLKAGIGGGIQQFEQGSLFCVVRAGRIAWCRANTPVTFLDQVFIGHLLVIGVTPELLANPFVHALGKGFRQAVRQGLNHDGAVVVVGILELGGEFVHANAGGDRKATHIITQVRAFRCHEIRQGHHWLARGFLVLLAQVVQDGEFLFAGLVGVHHNIVAPAIGWPEADHATGTDSLLLNHLLEQFLGVVEQVAGGFSTLGVVENRRVLAGDVPGDKERRPVDVFHQLVQVIVFKYPNTGERGFRRLVVLEIDFRCPCAGFFQGYQLGSVATVLAALTDLVVFGAGRFHERRLGSFAQQLGGHVDATGCVRHVQGNVVLVVRLNLDRGVSLGRGGATDHQRNPEVQSLHFAGNVHHFVQRRCNQAAQADDVHVFLLRRLKDLLAGHHHAHVDHFVVIALQHHAHDVLADVVHIAFHRSHQDLALGLLVFRFLSLNVRNQVGDRLLHYPGTFHHLGQEHLAVAKQVTDHVHAGHQRAFNHLDGMAGVKATGFGIFDDEVGDAFNQSVLKPLLNRPFAPGQVFFLGLATFALELLGRFQQAVGGIVAAVQDYVFHQLFEVRFDVVVDHQLAGVHDTHVQAGLDGVVQEYRMDGFAHGIVAPEREGHVAHTAGNGRVGQVLFNPAGGIDEVYRVVVVLFDAGGNGKDVRVEDDVGRVEADANQHIVGALTDFGFAFEGVGLAIFVKGHDHNRGAVAHAVLCPLDELFFAFFQADGVHHGLALDAAQAGFDHFPPGGVDHNGYAGNVRLGGDQVQEGDHHLLGIQHALVHVDVDDLGTVFNLVPGDTQGFFILLFLDQAQEALGAGYVGAFAHVDEQGVLVAGERLKASQPQGLWAVGNLPGRILGDYFGDGFDVFRAGTTAAADNVQEAVSGKAFNDLGHFFRGLVVLTELVGQARVRVRGDIGFRFIGKLFHIGAQGIGTQCAVQAHGNGAGVGNGGVECFRGLTGQGAARSVGNGAGDHDRQFNTGIFEVLLGGVDGRLGVQGIENGFDQDQVRATFHQA